MTRFSFPEYRRRLADNCENYSEGIETPNGEEIIFDEHQEEGLIASADAISSGARNFSVVHPTGTGKTLEEAALIKASQEAKSVISAVERDKRKDLILTVERSLMAGIRDEIERVLGREVGIFGDGKKKTSPGVIVASIQALQYHGHDLHESFDPEKVTLVIGDEADKYITENRAAVVDQFPNALKIGFTATPEWPDKRNVTRVWGNIVHRLLLREGMERGVNVPALFYILENEVNGDNIPRERGDYQRNALGKALKAVQIENAICDIYDTLPRAERREYPALVYVPTLQILEDVRSRMRSRFGNIRIASWNGRTKSAELVEDIRNFRRGGIDVLILCEMGGRGLNLPRARFLIDASPTLSPNKLEQRHGRILRTIRPGSPEAETGFEKNFSTIYQIVPQANSFQNPVTFLDILQIEAEDYEPHHLLPARNGRRRGPGDDPEIRRWVRHFKERPIRSNMRLLGSSDLREILRRRDLPTLDDNFFVYDE